MTATVSIALATALGAALISGVLLAFSGFVMRGLDRLGPAAATAAMQSINRTVLHPSFLGIFLGTTLSSAVLMVLAWTGGRPLLLAGSALYLLGTFAVTGLVNVPLNERLDEVDPRSEEAGTAWSAYLGRWLVWNHIRTLASAASAILLVAAVLWG